MPKRNRHLSSQIQASQISSPGMLTAFFEAKESIQQSTASALKGIAAINQLLSPWRVCRAIRQLGKQGRSLSHAIANATGQTDAACISSGCPRQIQKSKLIAALILEQ